MTIEQIQERLVALIVAMMDKGLVVPSAEMSIRANIGPQIWMHSGEYGRPGYFAKLIGGDEPSELLRKADAEIAALPDYKAAAVQRHMGRVADCIDKGREDGIDDAYITPLVAVKAAMTENLLTKGDAQ